ncbi:hypothetical protein ACFVU3_08100 [Streptomyces sp. NPDC058052]|uniref:hypothetical protein n=1 Tax=Streptomyces sp. NPDC058052 TaxID=3346316 RepID=UPI0036E8D489
MADQPEQPDPAGSRDTRQRAERFLDPSRGNTDAEKATAWALLACADELGKIRRLLERRR